MSKRILPLLLAVLLVMAGCTTQSAATTAPAAAATSAPAVSAKAEQTPAPTETPKPVDIYAKYDPPINMVAVRNVQLADTEVDFSKSLWVAQYQKVLGINLSYKLQAYGEQYDNKVNMLLASNDLADVMQVNLRQLYQMIDAGQVQDLNPAWNSYATDTVKKAMTADGTQNFDMATKDGKLYAIPSVNPAIETAHCLFVREDWRKKLNLPEPKTFDDFEKMIYAFANDDPDGNSVKDTYGLSINKDLFTDGHDVTTFFNCFGAFPKAWVKDKDGSLIYGGIQAGMVPALTKLAKYYQDGLIDKEFTVKDSAKAAENVTKGKVGVFFGIQWAGFVGDAVTSLYKNTNGACEWKSYPIPAANEDGMPIEYNSTKTFYVVKAGYEHPEALVNMVNYVVAMGRIGPNDTTPWAIKKADWQPLWDTWTSGLIVPEIIHNNVQRWLDTFAAVKSGDTSTVYSSYLCAGLYDGLNEWKKDGKNFLNLDTKAPDPVNAALWCELETCGETFMNTLAARDAGKLNQDLVGSFVSDTMLAKQATLDKLELETITRIITGDAQVSDFDSYVKEWKTLGGEQITKEINDWYSSIAKK